MCVTDDDFVLVQSVLAIPLIFCNRVFGGNFVHTLATIRSIENCDSFFFLAFSCDSRNLVSDNDSVAYIMSELQNSA